MNRGWFRTLSGISLESVAFCRLASPAVPDYTTCLRIIGLLASELNRFNTGVF
jgi:hypothetical protein